MALLALTLALLAITVATTAIEVKLLDMAPDSFDDQYQGCGRAMEVELLALNHSEFQNNPLFAGMWPYVMAKWQSQGSPVFPLSSPNQAIALRAGTTGILSGLFNEEVRVAGHSPQAYRDNFHFKTLHFLLTNALAQLRDTQEQQCHCVLWDVDKYKFKANVGDVIRLGQFASLTLCESGTKGFGSTMVFKVQTCHGVDIRNFSQYPDEDEVLIPPFEKFNVTKVIEKGKKVEIHLDSIGTYSKYNCEWLKGGSVPRAPFHRTGLLLATTALAVATGIL